MMNFRQTFFFENRKRADHETQLSSTHLHASSVYQYVYVSLGMLQGSQKLLWKRLLHWSILIVGASGMMNVRLCLRLRVCACACACARVCMYVRATRTLPSLPLPPSLYHVHGGWDHFILFFFPSPHTIDTHNRHTHTRIQGYRLELDESDPLSKRKSRNWEGGRREGARHTQSSRQRQKRWLPKKPWR